MLDITITTYEIRIGQRFSVSFQRTLRIPDDGHLYPLPPGLGAFPILKVEDYLDRVPSEWRMQGGGFIPMYQREALWLEFKATAWKPNAVQIAVGRVNTVSGALYDAILHENPQDYVVCPDQPWLDGFNTGHGSVRQFVAMPLGLGYTIEASVFGAETYGGIQITVFEPKPGKFPDAPPILPPTGTGMPVRVARAQPMGLGAGGTMRQKIYPDMYGIDTWDPEYCASVVVHIVNSEQFYEITGVEAPPTPVDAHAYTVHGLPWFDLYDEAKGDVTPSQRLREVKTILERDTERGEPAMDNTTIDVPDTQIEKLHLRSDSSEKTP